MLMQYKDNKRLKNCIRALVANIVFLVFYLVLQPFGDHIAKRIVGIVLITIYISICIAGEMLLLTMELTKEIAEKITHTKKVLSTIKSLWFGSSLLAIYLMFFLSLWIDRISALWSS